MNYRAATRSARFEETWSRADADLIEFLTKVGLVKAQTWAHLVPKSVNDFGAGADWLFDLLRGLGANEEQAERWHDCVRSLWKDASDDGASLAKRAGSLSGLHLSADALERTQEQGQKQEEADLRKLHAASLAQLPSEWRGKRYRRQQRLQNEAERADEEAAERTRWGREVAGLLVEAGLPFARTLGTTAPGSTLALRCCKGLRAKTLKQRVSCWRPLRRWLLQVGRPPFPAEASDFLGYLGVHEAQATRTTASSLLLALRFLEEAGEVPEGKRLSDDPALSNAAAENKTLPRRGPRAQQQAPPMVLTVLAALEDLVVDEGAQLYPRAFAWYRLFRHWSSLRWDDTQALLPASLERRARGVVGKLERTKTSGRGKNQLVLPVFVSDRAFLRTPWLDAGLVLWMEAPLNFQRDYFLPLPSEKLDGVLRRRALYSDCAGFSVALLSSLKDKHGHALLPPGAARFWTEHSDRSGVDGWCATLGFDESDRGFLGRWAAKGSADVYVRTALRVCENLQRAVTTFAQDALAAGPDYFGEEQVLADYASFLARAGLADSEVDAATARLKSCNYKLDPVARRQLDHGLVARAPAPELGPLALTDDEGEEEEAADEHEDEGEDADEPLETAPAAPGEGLATPKADDLAEKAAAEEVATAAASRPAPTTQPLGVLS